MRFLNGISSLVENVARIGKETAGAWPPAALRLADAMSNCQAGTNAPKSISAMRNCPNPAGGNFCIIYKYGYTN